VEYQDSPLSQGRSPSGGNVVVPVGLFCLVLLLLTLAPAASGMNRLRVKNEKTTPRPYSCCARLVTLLVTPCTGKTCVQVHSYAVESFRVSVAI